MRIHNNRKRNIGYLRQNKGGAAIEYIVVSTFALLVSVGAITWLGKQFKDRINDAAAKLKVAAPEIDIPE